MVAKAKSSIRRPTQNSTEETRITGSKSFGAEIALIQSTAYVGDDLSKVARMMYSGHRIDLPTAQLALSDLRRLLDYARGEDLKAEIVVAIQRLSSLIEEAERPAMSNFRWPWSR